MSMLVTGASGNLGRLVAARLLETHAPHEVVLATRTPAALADFAARGVDVREADFSRPSTLTAAFAGVERMLLISTDAIGAREAQHAAAIDAARDAGVSFVAYTSFPTPAVPSSPLAAEHVATEAALRASGMAWSILRNFPYAEGQIPEYERAVAGGELVSNTGGGRTAFVARADCADAAAAVLGTAGHDGTTYDLTGPEALADSDLAALFSELGGTHVALRRVDDAEFAESLSAASGMPLPMALGLAASVGDLTRSGLYAPVSADVELLTGRPATPLASALEAAIRNRRG